jgi:hypothetical protein
VTRTREPVRALQFRDAQAAVPVIDLPVDRVPAPVRSGYLKPPERIAGRDSERPVTSVDFAHAPPSEAMDRAPDHRDSSLVPHPHPCRGRRTRDGTRGGWLPLGTDGGRDRLRRRDRLPRRRGLVDSAGSSGGPCPHDPITSRARCGGVGVRGRLALPLVRRERGAWLGVLQEMREASRTAPRKLSRRSGALGLSRHRRESSRTEWLRGPNRPRRPRSR